MTSPSHVSSYFVHNNKLIYIALCTPSLKFAVFLWEQAFNRWFLGFITMQVRGALLISYFYKTSGNKIPSDRFKNPLLSSTSCTYVVVNYKDGAVFLVLACCQSTEMISFWQTKYYESDIGRKVVDSWLLASWFFSCRIFQTALKLTRKWW